ncbi:uncharacterized protein [Lolium perenne]|uniref:uncharacterized protein n=1 Tax=Lolium perenne TaxID=4522 RepID=UPI0021F62735|nr:uncharacterized protein LOC127319677 [Lolium perenne]
MGYMKRKEPDVEKQKEPILEHVKSALLKRYRLNFTKQDVSLWFLCKQEASLLKITNHACQRFNEAEDYGKRKEPDVDKKKEPILEHVMPALVNRYHLNCTKQDVSSLWFLCKQEASLLNITNHAHQLSNEVKVYLLEGTDDLEGFVVKGYGESISYKMRLPLLKDGVQLMKDAIIAKEENYPDGTYEKARLPFANAETLVHFTCLLGLFLEGSDFEKIQQEEPLDLPLMPPQKRNWKGGLVAPFASNNMLVLQQCPGKTGDNWISQGQNSSYFVQVLHNEAPVSMPEAPLLNLTNKSCHFSRKLRY